MWVASLSFQTSLLREKVFDGGRSKLIQPMNFNGNDLRFVYILYQNVGLLRADGQPQVQAGRREAVLQKKLECLRV